MTLSSCLISSCPFNKYGYSFPSLPLITIFLGFSLDFSTIKLRENDDILTIGFKVSFPIF